MDNSCKRWAYCLQCSIIIHTEHGQWQATFTQEKAACLVEVSIMKQILWKFPKFQQWLPGSAFSTHTQEPGNKATWIDMIHWQSLQSKIVNTWLRSLRLSRKIFKACPSLNPLCFITPILGVCLITTRTHKCMPLLTKPMACVTRCHLSQQLKEMNLATKYNPFIWEILSRKVGTRQETHPRQFVWATPALCHWVTTTRQLPAFTILYTILTQR